MNNPFSKLLTNVDYLVIHLVMNVAAVVLMRYFFFCWYTGAVKFIVILVVINNL